MKKELKNTNPLELDINDPYWRELKQSNIKLERWQLYILQNSAFWKGKRSKLIRDMFTDALTENGFAQVDRAVKREELVSIVKTAQAQIKGIDMADILELQEKQKEQDEISKAGMRDLMLSETILGMAKRLYFIREKRKIHSDASEFDELHWVTGDFKDLRKYGYEKQPADALMEVQHSLKIHKGSWDKDRGK